MINLMYIFILFSAFFSMTAYATCARTNLLSTGDTQAAKISFGTINIPTSSYLLPVGTSLGQVAVPATNYRVAGITADSVLWICDLRDAASIYYLVSTNGTDGSSGRDEVGRVDGLAYVYATHYQYVGLKLTMDNVEISRFYKPINIPSFLRVADKIHIRIRDIPVLNAELYRVSTLKSTFSWCGNQIVAGNYNCAIPNAYIQLKGPGIRGDQIGQDSLTNSTFKSENNGFGYSMRDGSRVANQPSCMARNVTPVVNFNPISSMELRANQSVSADFSVAIECGLGVISGTAMNQTAIGLQVSSGALITAQRLGLVNAQNGVSALVSDRYDDPQMAKGVGIFLSNANTGRAMNFIGQIGLSPGGAVAGWYPVLDGAQGNGSSAPQHTNYLHKFTATLKRLDGAVPISSGKVSATAYVLVKVQ